MVGPRRWVGVGESVGVHGGPEAIAALPGMFKFEISAGHDGLDDNQDEAYMKFLVGAIALWLMEELRGCTTV